MLALSNFGDQYFFQQPIDKDIEAGRWGQCWDRSRSVLLKDKTQVFIKACQYY